MEKRILKSEQEYFDLCVAEEIGSIWRKYGSQTCEIEYGEKCDEYLTTHCKETLHIQSKPTHYPCVLTWHCDCGDNDNFWGVFVYPEDLR